MPELFPETQPYDSGMLDVGDGNHVSWDVAGNPTGRWAVLLHGGPGQGSSPWMRRCFDPMKYRVVLFDQRGCGRSTPHASDPSTDLQCNTTWHLVADVERLRAHLGIDRWLVCGGSWGSTLALAYAQHHPERVSAIVLLAITTGRRAESDWLYEGAGRFFPEAYEKFRSGVPEAMHGRDVVSAYVRRMEHMDPAVRLRAALDWCAWEAAVLSLEPNPSQVFSFATEPELLAFVRICAHYVHHGAWLDEGALIRDAAKLRGIPGVLLHGRRDMSCPTDSAWALAKAWPGAQLTVLDDSGHLGSDARRELLLAALDRLAE